MSAEDDVTVRQFAIALAKVMREKDMKLEAVQKRAPNGLWEAACTKLNEEGGLKTARDKLWTVTNASAFWKRHSKAISTFCQDIMGVDHVASDVQIESEEEDISIQKASETPQQPDHEPQMEPPSLVTRDELKAALGAQSDDFQKDLKEVSQSFQKLEETVRKLQEVTMQARPSQTISGGLPPLPPSAPLQGLKKLGTRVKVAGTIDQALMDLIEAERSKRNCSLSAMIDCMVWHYFDRPKLSFESETITDPHAEEEVDGPVVGLA